MSVFPMQLKYRRVYSAIVYVSIAGLIAIVWHELDFKSRQETNTCYKEAWWTKRPLKPIWLGFICFVLFICRVIFWSESKGMVLIYNVHSCLIRDVELIHYISWSTSVGITLMTCLFLQTSDSDDSETRGKRLEKEFFLEHSFWSLWVLLYRCYLGKFKIFIYRWLFDWLVSFLFFESREILFSRCLWVHGTVFLFSSK